MAGDGTGLGHDADEVNPHSAVSDIVGGSERCHGPTGSPHAMAGERLRAGAGPRRSAGTNLHADEYSVGIKGHDVHLATSGGADAPTQQPPAGRLKPSGDSPLGDDAEVVTRVAH